MYQTTSLHSFACVKMLHVCVAHVAPLSVRTERTWTGSSPTCVWVKPITADDSCGAAGRQ